MCVFKGSKDPRNRIKDEGKGKTNEGGTRSVNVDGEDRTVTEGNTKIVFTANRDLKETTVSIYEH